MKNLTFTMVKPDAVRAGNHAAILMHLANAGFRIVALRMHQLSREDAERFYAVHYGKPFYEGLINFMTSGPIVAAVLEKENAVAELRKTVGATNPEEAEEGTVRKLYGSSVQQNAIHASDSDENAAIEWAIHFDESEIFA